MKLTLNFPRWNLWVWCFALLMTGGIYASYVRLVHGIGRFGSDGTAFPWDLITGLNVFCGIAIAAGGFTVAASTYVLNLEGYRPIVRASLVLSFLGYVVAVLGLVSSPGRIAFQVGVWNSHSILYGFAWALILFAAVLVVEFAPELWERFGGREPPRWMRFLSMPLLFFAVVLSVLYQTSLADLLQTLPERVSPLWSTPQLPFFFFVSAVCAGLAVVIFASWHMKVLAALLFLYLGVRIADLVYRGVPLLVWKNNPENVLLGLEMGLILLPMVLLINERSLENPRIVYLCSGMVLAGLITNRLNACITSVEAATNSKYLPGWNEFLVAYSIVALGVAAFSWMAKRLPLFLEAQGEQKPRLTSERSGMTQGPAKREGFQI
jgi:Ni/Fe-hydrogenase subunit HybB-like protein